MLSLTVLFWLFVLLFAVIGATRGWAKEMLVTFSVILSMFLINLVSNPSVPVLGAIVSKLDAKSIFWVRAVILIMLVFFGYQTPNLRAITPARFARERLQDVLLGFLLGALNGYLVAGSLIFFLHNAGYPFPDVVSAPDPNTQVGRAVYNMIKYMPPNYLMNWVTISVAVGLAFLFVIVVFI